DDFTPRRCVPLAPGFRQPGVKELVPLVVRTDAQRLEIPAVFAVVLRGQLRPELGRFRGWIVPQSDGGLAADLRRRVSRKLLQVRHNVELQLPGDAQAGDAE